MKKSLIITFSIAALCIFGCAKMQKTGANEDNKRYFEAWMSIYHPDLKPTGLGIYVLEEEPGTGKEVLEDGCAFVDYTVTDLEGNISSYTGKMTAKQLGTYDTTTYYGPAKWFTTPGVLQAGIHDALIGMKVGGKKKFIVPSWLMSYKVYDSEEDYLKQNSGEAAAIYDITVRDYTDSIQLWQIEQIGRYFVDNQDTFKGMTVADSTKCYGFYYKELVPPTVTDTLKADTTIYINYTGKLLNGLVFDTTIEKVAKDNGLYSASRSYEPVPVQLASEYSDITLSGNSIIDGFALTIKQMSDYEKGVSVFWAPLGYGSSGNSGSIPGYEPLVFEIELVDNPEE